MKNSFNADSILYYPTIEFQNETWVKSTLSFWDRVYRIVPNGYHPNDSEEIYIAKQEGLIVDIDLTSEDLKRTAIEFEKFCDDASSIPAGLDASLYEVRLHSDKIDERLKPFFTQFSKSIDSEGFYKLPSKIANGYMFFLSDAVSKRRNIPKLTDNPDMFTAMTYFDVEGNIDHWYTDDEASESYSNLVIENLIPADIRSLSIKELIKINSGMAEYKKEFRKSVSDFSEKITKIEDAGFALQELKNFKNELTQINANKNEVLRTYVKELQSSLLYVGLPLFTTSMIGSIYSTPLDLYSTMVQVSKGIFLGGVASLGNAAKDVRKRWTSSQSNYYLELKKHLTSPDNAQIRITNMNDRMEEFIND
ncbi:hypothetical protein AAEO56_17675 [Flavobacterium sp. DGU11]|uniref:Uncharacterized protein n=1 Tax=Flavobacterium arundinis TaxID=3139143 RepID=A0ABU9I0Z8_9FLAO